MYNIHPHIELLNTSNMCIELTYIRKLKTTLRIKHGEAYKLCLVQLHFTYVKLKLSMGDNNIPPGHHIIYIGQMKIYYIINIVFEILLSSHI